MWRPTCDRTVDVANPTRGDDMNLYAIRRRDFATT
jgi:hypothetical protein